MYKFKNVVAILALGGVLVACGTGSTASTPTPHYNLTSESGALSRVTGCSDIATNGASLQGVGPVYDIPESINTNNVTTLYCKGSITIQFESYSISPAGYLTATTNPTDYSVKYSSGCPTSESDEVIASCSITIRSKALQQINVPIFINGQLESQTLFNLIVESAI